MSTISEQLKAAYEDILVAEFEGTSKEKILKNLCKDVGHRYANTYLEDRDEGIVFSAYTGEENVGKYVWLYPYPFVQRYFAIDAGNGKYRRVHQAP